MRYWVTSCCRRNYWHIIQLNVKAENGKENELSHAFGGRLKRVRDEHEQANELRGTCSVLDCSREKSFLFNFHHLHDAQQQL